jgi:hypothetical protein
MRSRMEEANPKMLAEQRRDNSGRSVLLPVTFNHSHSPSHSILRRMWRIGSNLLLPPPSSLLLSLLSSLLLLLLLTPPQTRYTTTVPPSSPTPNSRGRAKNPPCPLPPLPPPPPPPCPPFPPTPLPLEQLLHPSSSVTRHSFPSAPQQRHRQPGCGGGGGRGREGGAPEERRRGGGGGGCSARG